MIDTILYLENILLEDDRYVTDKPADASYHGINPSINWDDPKLWSSNAFGKTIQKELNGMGGGFSVEVTDFNKWVVVKVNYNNCITGRVSSKTFLIVFSNKSNGIVLSTANKWRSISGYSQAVSYIKSASQSLKSSSDQKI